MKFPFRILCVDDDETCEMLNATFKSSGIEIISANTVAEGWRLAQSENFDLYLLATRFADGDGFDLCRRIHNLVANKPVVFYSADAYPADEQRGLAAGAAAYLVKPYFGDLEATILKHIEHAGKSAAMIYKSTKPTANYLKTAHF
ncbi:MAG: response regulator [Acidobacteriota bacterium]|nr:response regulator [Acidobacteriota bacterium]